MTSPFSSFASYSSTPLPRATPEAQGVSSAAVLSFLNAIAVPGQEIHSVMVLRHGNVIAEGWWAPYAPEHPHMLYSLSKSFTSTAAGFAVAEGTFSLDDKVVSFFPDDLPPEVSTNLAAMRVRDLLAMATGHETEPSGRNTPDGNWVKAFLAHPVPHEPGTHFLYNSMATYMVSAIVQKTTGQDLLDYLGPRLFVPLGIDPPTWERDPRGIPVGGWGLNLRTEDIAKFGQLYLDNGVWNNKQLLPEGWVATATTSHISNGSDASNDWNQGYGFQFWRCRNGAYRGDGAFGQYCVVMPDQDTVVAITSRVENMGAVLNGIWNHLLPALTAAPLPENHAAQTALIERLSNLAIPLQQGERDAAIAAQVAGKPYHFAPNDLHIEAATLSFGDGDGVLLLQIDGEEYPVAWGFAQWVPGSLKLLHANPCPIVSSGAWIDNNTLALRVCLYETPFIPTITCHFEGDSLRLTINGSLGFGPKERPALEGKII